MATPAPQTFKPHAPGRRVRLDSLKNPQPRAPSEGRFSRPPPSRPTQSSKPQCRNSQCAQSNVIEDDGKMICMSCGFVINDVQITQDLQFGEAANGAAIVQGVYVGAGDETARSAGLGGSRITGGLDSRMVTQKNGIFYINQFVAALHLTATHKERAARIFSLAHGNNFIQGRVTRHVAAICTYVACRQERDCKIMLIDFAEILNLNVFKLGAIFEQLVKELRLRGDADSAENPGKSEIFEVNPENLIYRFAQDLEFGLDTNRIANEAVQIVKRMKKDWIHVGRRPAGVCAAAIILAARMNNYRRTVREVVYTAKVCDITIHKRLEEFKYTEASKLTVSQFRHYGLEFAQETDPPAYYEQFQKKKRRKRAHQVEQDDDMMDGTPQPVATAPEQSQAPPENPTQESTNTEVASASTAAPPVGDETRDRSTMSPAARARADRVAMPPPASESVDAIDPALLGDDEEHHLTALAAGMGDPERTHREGSAASNTSETTAAGQKRKRGRKPGSKNKPLPFLTDSAIESQNEIENEVSNILDDPNTLETAAAAHDHIASSIEKTNEGAQSNTGTSADATGEAESVPAPNLEYLDEDPEVSTCLLSPAEIILKERIWVHENAAYLREKQARKIKAELAEAAGTVPQKKTRQRRRGRMGDKNWIRGENGEDLPKTAGEAVGRMMEKRAYSKKINYQKIVDTYDNRKSTRSKTTTAEPSPRDSESAAPEEDEHEEEESEGTTPEEAGERQKAVDVDVETTGLQTPQATAESSKEGAAKDQPIEIQDNGTPSEEEEEEDEEDPDDYFQEDEEIEPQEEGYEFGNDDEDDGEVY